MDKELGDNRIDNKERLSNTNLRDWLFRVVSLGYLAGILGSYELWIELERSFPRVPLLPRELGILVYSEYLLSAILVICLFTTLSNPRMRSIAWVIVLFTLLLSLLDQNRLQPWVYQYCILLAVLKLTDGSSLRILPVFLGGFYLWSGVQKLNFGFVSEVLPKLAGFLGIETGISISIALTVVVIEILTGALLFFSRTRRVGYILAITMHALIIVVLAFGWHNSIVWVWNGTLIVFLILMFRFSSEEEGGRMSTTVNSVVAVVLLIPCFNFLGYWDHYLSGGLYSGNAPVAVIRIENESALPPAPKSVVFSDSRGNRFLPLHEWSMKELNVPPPPEPRVFDSVFERVCEWTHEGTELIVKSRKGWFGTEVEIERRLCKR